MAISEVDYIISAPELIAEVASGSVSYDRHSKKNVYQSHAVREYLACGVFEREIDWFSLRGNDYITLKLDDSGIVRSEIFPGLWLVVPALILRLSGCRVIGINARSKLDETCGICAKHACSIGESLCAILKS